MAQSNDDMKGAEQWIKTGLETVQFRLEFGKFNVCKLEVGVFLAKTDCNVVIQRYVMIL
jgi:hypothetical protein